jgi:ADP-ribose pyrophosphatase
MAARMNFQGGISSMHDDVTDLSESQLSSRTVFKGRLLHVKEDTVLLPNGRETVREYIEHPGAVVIVPLFENGDILLERQYRYPLRRDFIELPAGKIDPGEDVLACGQRELLEETGYTASEWQYLTTAYPCIGYSDERLVYYLAGGLDYSGHQPDEDEFLEILRMPIGQALDMVKSGEICEAKTLIGLYWLEKILSEGL